MPLRVGKGKAVFGNTSSSFFQGACDMAGKAEASAVSLTAQEIIKFSMVIWESSEAEHSYLPPAGCSP